MLSWQVDSKYFNANLNNKGRVASVFLRASLLCQRCVGIGCYNDDVTEPPRAISVLQKPAVHHAASVYRYVALIPAELSQRQNDEVQLKTPL